MTLPRTRRTATAAAFVTAWKAASSRRNQVSVRAWGVSRASDRELRTAASRMARPQCEATWRGLTVHVLDLRPGLLDARDHRVRHRDVIQALGQGVALVVGPYHPSFFQAVQRGG